MTQSEYLQLDKADVQRGLDAIFSMGYSTISIARSGKLVSVRVGEVHVVSGLGSVVRALEEAYKILSIRS